MPGLVLAAWLCIYTFCKIKIRVCLQLNIGLYVPSSTEFWIDCYVIYCKLITMEKYYIIFLICISCFFFEQIVKTPIILSVIFFLSPLYHYLHITTFHFLFGCQEDKEALAGYLSLHQCTEGLIIMWTPNQLMNGCCDETQDETDRR